MRPFVVVSGIAACCTDPDNRYIKHFFSGSLEVCVMALRQWEHTQNATYAAR